MTIIINCNASSNDKVTVAVSKEVDFGYRFVSIKNYEASKKNIHVVAI